MKHAHHERPLCMQVLGLLPPYSTEDVEKAYREKAKTVHPDAGGDPELFKALHDAYRDALDLVNFQKSRRHWMGTCVDRHLERRELIKVVESCGGHYTLQRNESYLDAFGPDFGDLLRELVTVRLTGPLAGDDALAKFTEFPSAAREIRMLSLEGSKVTDEGLQALAGLNIQDLDVSRTQVSMQGLKVLEELPLLHWLNVDQTRVGMWGRRRLRRRFPHLTLVTEQRPNREPETSSYGAGHILERLRHALD